MTVGAPLGDHTCIHDHQSFRHPCRLCGFEVEERERERIRENQRESERIREKERARERERWMRTKPQKYMKKRRTSRKKERKRAREREALRFQSPEGSFLALGSQAPVHNSQLNNIGA